MDTQPLAREIVLVGGGHSHVLLLRMLGMNPVPGLRVTLISPHYLTPYSGMLPGLVAGHYTEDEAYIDLAPLCRFANAALVLDEAIGLDESRQEVQCKAHPAIRYDLLSIDVGIGPKIPPGLYSPEVIPVKPIGEFLARWRSFLDQQKQAPVRNLAVIGAGAGGVELLLAIQHALDAAGLGSETNFHCFTDQRSILPNSSTGMQRRFEKLLRSRGITIHWEFKAASLGNGLLTDTAGRTTQVDVAFLVTEASPHDWLQHTSLAKDDQGFIAVGDTLQSLSHDNIFAVGDCATMINHPRPKAGVYAVRQGRPLFRNIIRHALGRPLRDFKPQQRFLTLISTGSKSAVAARNGMSISGKWVWRWKDWIDRRFMKRFSQLPEMPATSASPFAHEFDEQMQCGGCGSKVGADLLQEVLQELTASPPADDASATQVPNGKIVVQSVDHFRAFVDDPYLLARIAVCHALSDIYACGAHASLAHAMITLPYAKPAITRHLLRQIMAGTLNALQEEGVELAGGHTSYGKELALGFAVTGFVEPAGLWTKGGLRPGDKLVLTKPLGTGTVFAADMRGKANGAWVQAALAAMSQSNKAGMEALRGYDVSACTDVTGFGLAGHLTEMLTQSGAGATIESGSIPLLDGVDECFAQGIFSSLHDANQAAFRCAGDPLPILYDPQTAGGLLAGMSAEDAAACVQALRASGYNAATVIGEVTEGQGLISALLAE